MSNNGEFKLFDQMPQHIAIVMDGNGRWAENQGLERLEGHRVGAEIVKRVIRCCLEAQISILSLFAFSSENWARPENEVSFLMKLFLEALNKEVDELHHHGVRMRFTGNRAGLSLELREQMKFAEELTASNTKLILNIVVNYGGKWDILQATQSLIKQVCAGDIQVEEINESLFEQALSTADLPNPDLLIRTSGEQRISNFFLWQLAYTEFYFTNVPWPEFDKKEFDKALTAFCSRERRYGKTSKQIK